MPDEILTLAEVAQMLTYVLIPHDAIAENMTVEGLARQYAVGDAVPARG